MNVNQIYPLINDINDQMWGKDAVDVHDLSGLISLGQQFSGDLAGADKFLGKLVDRIGKTVLRTLDLELDFPSLYRDSFEFGAMLQKISMNPIEAIATSEWKVGEVDFTPTFANVVKNDDIHICYFTDADTFKFMTTIPHSIFFTAFTSESAMSAFMDGLIQRMTDSVTMAVNNFSRAAVNNFIAEKIIAGNGIVNLRDLYNSAYGYTGIDAKSAADCMVDKEFYRFAATVIRKYIKYLAQPSTLYNCGINGNPIVRATARDNMHVFFLTDLAAGFDSYLYGDSITGDKFYDVPNYAEIGFWQGDHSASGDNTFDVNSSIEIIPSSQKSVTNPENRYAISQSGIVALLADRQAIALGINKRRSGAFNNDIDDYSNYCTSITQQWINDTSENAIIFLVADSVVTPSISVDKSSLTFASAVADSQTITATTMPADATVTWKTSKSAVATVSDGVVSPAGTGSCNITAEITVGGVKYTATTAVTVG